MNYQQTNKLSAKSQQLQKTDSNRQRKSTIARPQPGSATSLKSKCSVPAKRPRPSPKFDTFETRRRKEMEEKTKLELNKNENWSALKGIKPVAQCSKNVKTELTSCLQEMQGKRSVYDKRPKPLMAKIINIIAAQDRQCERLEAKRMFEARMERRKRMMQYHEDELQSTRNYFDAKKSEPEPVKTHPKPNVLNTLSREKKIKISSAPNKPKIYQFTMKNTNSNGKFINSANKVGQSEKPTIIIPESLISTKCDHNSDSALRVLRKFYSGIARSDGRSATAGSPLTAGNSPNTEGDFLELLQRKIDVMYENIHDFEKAKKGANPLNSLDDTELHELIENIEEIL